jgi:hypothetical protein
MRWLMRVSRSIWLRSIIPPIRRSCLPDSDDGEKGPLPLATRGLPDAPQACCSCVHMCCPTPNSCLHAHTTGSCSGAHSRGIPLDAISRFLHHQLAGLSSNIVSDSPPGPGQWRLRMLWSLLITQAKYCCPYSEFADVQRCMQIPVSVKIRFWMES